VVDIKKMIFQRMRRRATHHHKKRSCNRCKIYSKVFSSLIRRRRSRRRTRRYKLPHTLTFLPALTVELDTFPLLLYIHV